MGGAFQETITITVTSDGAGAGNDSGVINIPFRYGYLSQINIDQTSGDATNFAFNIYDSDNAGTPYTTETNQYLVKSVADAARTEYGVRQDHSFFRASATEDPVVSTMGTRALTIYIAYTGATGASAVTYTVVLGGIGIGA